ncbi:hypothetical protein XO10_06085 [Marinitoga sp. 1135]|uniref:DUF1659 domain-containing protein n=1 Tax=Marinitoga piezophila (strain DSM 14283 / JCM 11233 / KA3) TaxID=443254 RepID=H2J2V4_MARPK|nr:MULTISPECIES: DUF1659 domain-containing protein [Marinitoga]AEX85645.1 Protein of unknown function (DUF1659) [Marinitoga piezophila KA3]NUU95847.1 hypothetical protein [Marinitoga sp. 1135]NUU97761.1 hypothetical protein [Marinitoga sp. 1138]
MATKLSAGEKVRIGFDYGLDANGKKIIKRKSFTIMPGATDDQVYTASNNFASLCEKPLLKIEKIENYELQA